MQWKTISIRTTYLLRWRICWSG